MLPKKKINIEVVLTNNFDMNVYMEQIENSVCAVIDTLRATSTMVAIFGAGCRRIILAQNKNEAYALKDIFKDYLLCGEEKGFPPEGFDFGNSPCEFSKMDLRGKKIILMTTNGTVSFFKLKSSKYSFALSTLNLYYAADMISDLAKKESKDIFIVCSGIKGKITYDDVYTAGMTIKYLLKDNTSYNITDSAMVALDIAVGEPDIFRGIEKSISGLISKDLGFIDDLKFCIEINRYKLIPRLKVIDINDKNKSKFYYQQFKDIFNSFPNLQKKYPFDSILILENFPKTIDLN